MEGMEEELPFLSSSPLVTTAPAKVKPQDELDLPALKRIKKILTEQIRSYASIDRLTVEEKDMTLQQQLAVNKAIKLHLTEFKLLVDTVITNVEESYE